MSFNMLSGALRDIIAKTLSEAMEKTRAEISGGIQDAIVPQIVEGLLCILAVAAVLIAFGFVLRGFGKK